jgi:hypothetical protein
MPGHSKRERLNHIRRIVGFFIPVWVLLLAAAAITPSALAQTQPNFSGTWKMNSERSQPRRKGEAVLVIDHRDPLLTVETTLRSASGTQKKAVQRYTTDGKSSVSTGADGDEFHTSITWKGESLAFEIEEHEDGKILHSTETWTLIENGAALRRVRQRQQGGEDQVVIYERQAQGSGTNSEHPTGAGSF